MPLCYKTGREKIWKDSKSPSTQAENQTWYLMRCQFIIIDVCCLNSFGDENIAEEGFGLENQVTKAPFCLRMLLSDPQTLSYVF